MTRFPRFLKRSRGQRCSPWSSSWCGALGLLLSFGCNPYAYTTRVVDGREVQGAPIAPQAYAAYLEGATFEARGQLPAALAAYERARDADPDAAELQTALARTLCRIAPQQTAGEFEKAIELDPSYEPAHREQAYCALSRGDTALARAAAERALDADPHGFAATEVLAAVLLRQGKLLEAERFWLAFTVLHPEQPAAKHALQQVRQLKAQPAVSTTRLTPRLKQNRVGPVPQRPLAHFSKPELLLPLLQQALRDGDDGEAEALAQEARIERVEFGRIALAQARPDFALRQAQLVLFAEPTNSDARVLSLLAALVLQDGRAYRSALRDPGALVALPSAGGAADLMRVLEVKVSPHAAELFQEAYRNVSAASQPALLAPAPALPHERWPGAGQLPPTQP